MSRIKLLRDEVETVEDDGIKLTVKVITTSQQARVLDLNSRCYDAEGKCNLFAYILNNCIEAVKIDGTKYNPVELAEIYNVADDSTFNTFKQISDMAMRTMGIKVVDAAKKDADESDDGGAPDEEKK